MVGRWREYCCILYNIILIIIINKYYKLLKLTKKKTGSKSKLKKSDIYADLFDDEFDF